MAKDSATNDNRCIKACHYLAPVNFDYSTCTSEYQRRIDNSNETKKSKLQLVNDSLTK